MKFKFKIIAAILTAMALFTGCIGSKNDGSDDAKGVDIKRDGIKLSVYSDEVMYGAEYIVNQELTSESIEKADGTLVIVKSAEEGKSIISVAAVSGDIEKGEKLFDIVTGVEGTKIEELNVINSSNIGKEMKKASETRTGRKVVRTGNEEILLGDFNNDNKIDLIDFIAFSDNYGGDVKYDIAPASKGVSAGWENIYAIKNSDGAVDILDFVIFGMNYGKSITPDIVITGSSSVEAGKTVELSANIDSTWESLDTTVVTLSPSQGTKTTVTAVKAGTAVIKATSGNKSSTFTITVTPVAVPVPTAVDIAGLDAVDTGSKIVLTATVKYSDNTTKSEMVTWTSSDTTIATCDDLGITTNVTGVKAGTVKIKAEKEVNGVKVFLEKTVTVNAGTLPTTLGDMHPATGVYSPVDSAAWGSAAYKLGANFNGTDLEIAIFSSKATKVLLEIYDTEYGKDAKYDYWMVKGSDNIWRAKIKDAPVNTFYAFRMWGPNWTYDASWKRGNSNAGFVSDVDGAGNRFNPNKVLYDPYARELSHDDESIKLFTDGLNGEIYASGETLYKGAARRIWDTGKYAPKGIVIKDSTPFGTKPAIAKNKAMIYEAQVRALSKSESAGNLTTILAGMSEFDGIENIPEDERGTYIGAGKMAKYLKGLGFNTIELLPIHECFNNEINDFKANTNEIAGAENFWGYMTANFFSPDRRYAKDKTPGGPTREFKQMVKMFHDAGIEVYLDVVYNHTGEGGLWKDTDVTTAKIVSFRGIDNVAYYQLLNSNQKYQNDSGCGNNFAGANSTVAGNLVKDSINYWIDEMGVDGFRYDLAPVLGRDALNASGWYAFNGNAQLLKDLDSIGNAKNVEMIAEAWDCGAYVLTQFPGNWSDWNGKFRDNLRGSIKDGYWGSIGDIMQGSAAAGFGYNASIPESVNFVTAHDGNTMMDLVSYNLNSDTQTHTHNLSLAWPFGPSDGGNGNNVTSDNGGNQELRRQKLRNFWTILYFSKGIPMSLYGDEFGRTQNGNNNTYNVDSVATWNNYAMINTDSPNKVAITGGTYHNNFGTDTKADSKNGLFLFVKELLKVRNSNSALSNPATIFSNWATADAWAATGSFTIEGGTNGTFCVMVNMSGSEKTFNIPGGAAAGWKRIIDTGAWAEPQGNIWTLATAWTVDKATYGVGANTVVIFQK